MQADSKKVLWLSIAFMGLAHLTVLKKRLTGAMFALVEVAFIAALPVLIIPKLAGLITLGSPQPDVPIKLRDNSMFLMIDGIVVLAVIALFAAVYYISVRNALSAHSARGDGPFPVLALAPSVLLVLFFVIVPLVFSACVAFTNYSTPGHIPPNNTVDWVGMDNFAYMFGGDATWGGALARVAIWTLVWAFCATFTCYFGGMIMAVIMNNTKTRLTPVFRSIFILPYAVPAVVSMLVWRNMLNGAFGVVNRTLTEIGLISGPIPWLSDELLAKFVTVTLNLWAGFPYFMLLTMGTMTAISADIFEAARIDGANSFQIFRRITLPLVIYQTAPLIIMSFTMNINNFGAIFFLTGGNPIVADTTTTSAKGTDILVSWIYNLTITLQKYQYASVLAVMIFVVLAPFAIYNFRRTKSYKEGEI